MAFTQASGLSNRVFSHKLQRRRRRRRRLSLQTHTYVTKSSHSRVCMRVHNRLGRSELMRNIYVPPRVAFRASARHISRASARATPERWRELRGLIWIEEFPIAKKPGPLLSRGRLLLSTSFPCKRSIGRLAGGPAGAPELPCFQ